jgi:hypothetical protein
VIIATSCRIAHDVRERWLEIKRPNECSLGNIVALRAWSIRSFLFWEFIENRASAGEQLWDACRLGSGAG